MQAKKLGKTGEEQRKPIQEEGKKVDFFPQGKSQQGVVEEMEEEEEYLAIGEDRRPYITVRKKQEIRWEDQKKPVLDEEKKVDFSQNGNHGRG